MVQLKSFKSISDGAHDIDNDNENDEQQVDKLAEIKVTQSRSSSVSSSGGDGGGAALTLSSDDGRTLCSNEEYQSANVELEEEEDDEQEAEVMQDCENVTKIEIENEGKLKEEKKIKTPQAAKLKLQMPNSITSPNPIMASTSMLQQQQQQQSQQSQVRVLRERVIMPINSPLMRTKIAIGSQPPLDSTSQSLSFNGQQQQQQQQKLNSNNQFEIRWHNVKLSARPKSRIPSLISDSYLYKSLFGSNNQQIIENEQKQQQQLTSRANCYSPVLQHKIPPTIDEEGLEMRVGVGDNLPYKLNSINTTTTTSIPVDNYNNTSNVSNTSNVRCILNNISGQVFSGQLTAILGPSGVGKTTLLNSLTGRNTLDGTGKVQLIGSNLTERKRMSVVTVPQVDVLPGKLTTLEDLQFTSRLKNPQVKFNHQHNIERIVKHLHMEKFLHTQIDKLSGGEARRLSIARELLASPDLMILDEPTSGLDANTCKKIITALRDIVEHSDNILDKPMAIIITIHQPQREVYNLFHRIYVMAQGGRAIYEGSPGLLLPTLIEQSSLNSRVALLDQPLNENPAIVAIEVASGEHGLELIEELAAYHENQVYEEFVLYNAGIPSTPGAGIGSTLDSPLMGTPRSLRNLGAGHKSPALSVARFTADHQSPLHRKRLNSFDNSIGRPTPTLSKRGVNNSTATTGFPLTRMSSMTSLSYASTYDADLPEVTSKLKVDKRLRRSVVMKSHFWSHTGTLIKRCWLLTQRDLFLMAIRILGFLLVAGGTVQIFSHSLDPDENQCPQFESKVDDLYAYLTLIRGRLVGLLDMLRQGNSTHLLFFHLLLCITMVTSALTGLVFPLQMRMFMREYKNGWYSPASFVMSQTIAELPADIIGPLLTLVIMYPLCHQPDSLYYWREIAYAITLIITSIICKSQAQIVGAFLMDSVENSVFISCVCVTAPALLSGIPLRIQQMITPLQWVSYTSFLRYSFESLLSLRYGYGMCPCNPELVDGYPITASAQAIPAHLENLATGLLELSSDNQLNATSLQPNSLVATTMSTSVTNAQLISGNNDNLFIKFIQLITDASNFFVAGKEISTCERYRSLYLIGMEIPSDVFTRWIGVMFLMFILSRFLTYFAVKTVIKLRRN